MLSGAERQAILDRIAGNVEQFDDDTLVELERLTDPETHTVGGERPAAETGLSRRQLIAGAVAGGTIVALAGAGVTAVVRGGTDDAELSELREVNELYEELERADIDAAVAAAIGAYGSEVEAAQGTADALSAGLELVDRVLATAAIQLDPGIATALEDQVLGPGRKAATDLYALGDSWVITVEEPLEARLAARADTRRAIERAKAG